MPKSKVKSQTLGFLERAFASTAKAVRMAATDSKHSSKPAGSKPKRKKDSATGGFQSSHVELPAAQASISATKMGGMAELRGHVVRWLTGYVYIGNGTVGANDQVYFATATSGNTTVYKNLIPVAMADATFGTSYISDILKHYAQKRVRRLIMDLTPYGIGTQSTAGISLTVAPYRGGALAVAAVTDTTAGNVDGVVVGMKGALQFPSWKSVQIDMTPYIANAAGGNIFNIATSAAIASRDVTANAMAIPCGFALSGANAGSTSNRGLVVAKVSFTAVLDTIDFIGGFSQGNPAEPVSSAIPETKVSVRVVESKDSTTSTNPVVDGEWELVKAVFPNETIAVSAFRSLRTGEIKKDLPGPTLVRR